MNWYNLKKAILSNHSYPDITIKTAAPKNQIQKYKITDPSLKFFIYTYERTIPWEKIEATDHSEDQIQNYIKSSLLPSLHRKIDPSSEKSNYMKMTEKDVLEEIQHDPNNPQVQEAARRFRANPQEAMEFFSRIVNTQKKISFDNWWKYLTEDDIYKNNPAFIYSVLKPIIDSSPSTVKAPPPPVNAEALVDIWREINDAGVTQLNVYKKYNEISSRKSSEGTEKVQSSSGGEWIRIPSRINDPANFDKNVEKLKSICTGTKWCVAGEPHASNYLSKGDFWLYLLGGKTVVAIRLDGPTRVAEIRGYANIQENLNPYWEPVTKFLHTTNFSYRENPHYQELEKMMIMNSDLDKETDESLKQSRIQQIIESIRSDPKKYGLVSEKNKIKFPIFREEATRVYEQKLNAILDAIENISPDSNTYYSHFSHFQDEYKIVPEDVKKSLSGRIGGRILDVHKKAFSRNPTEFEYFPPEIKKAITPEEQFASWRNYISEDPYRFNDKRMPPEVRNKIPKNIVINGWLNLIDMNIKHIDNLPGYIRREIDKKDPNYIKQKIVKDFSKAPFHRSDKGYEKLDRVVSLNLLSEDEIGEIYANAIRIRPDLFVAIPRQYKTLVQQKMKSGDMESVLNQTLQGVLRDPRSFGSLDSERQSGLIQQYPQQIVNAFLSLKNVYRGNLDNFWKVIPGNVRSIMPESVKDEMASYYKTFVDRNRAFLAKVPPDLQAYVLKKIGSVTHAKKNGRNMKMNWYKKLAGSPRYPGQLQGDESRTGTDSMSEHLSDNAIAEGEYVDRLAEFARRGDLKGMGEYAEQLKREGHSVARVQSMITRAFYHKKLPKKPSSFV